MQKWFKALYDKAGIVGVGSHSGCRTFITRLIEQGADIPELDQNMHFDQTRVYTRDLSKCEIYADAFAS